MENYFIIHGSFGSPFSNWFCFLYDFLEGEGKEVYVSNAGHINSESGYDTFEDIIFY